MLKKPEKFSGLEPESHNGVLILDSGIGSLNLLREVKKILLNVPVTAVADNAKFPYGHKTPSEITARVCELAEFFLPLTHASTLLVACNTASTVALPSLRNRLDIPVVGIVPAVKPAASYSKSGTIALLATPETARGAYVDTLIAQHAENCRVLKIGCSRLAALSENKAAGIPVAREEIISELAPLLEHPEYSLVDAVILGCTHFSLLLEEFQAIFTPKVQIFDPASAVAQQVKKVHNPTSESKISNLVFTAYPTFLLDYNLCVDRLFYL